MNIEQFNRSIKTLVLKKFATNILFAQEVFYGMFKKKGRS
jgi:hypothetical protein